MMVSINCREGDWFAVPLREGGFAVGVVARLSSDGVLLGYFFGPKLAKAPALAVVVDLKADDAILVARFGHLGISQGKWPTLGRVDAWERDRWPMPLFGRYEELKGRSFKVRYDENNPNKMLDREQVLPGSSEQLPKETLLGAGAAEKVLTALLR
jgi:hypothetical protein